MQTIHLENIYLARTASKPQVARYILASGSIRYCIIDTVYGILHNTSGEYRFWKTYSGARKALVRYLTLKRPSNYNIPMYTDLHLLKSFDEPKPRVARYTISMGHVKYIVVGTDFGFLSTKLQGVRLWNTYSGAYKGMRRYLAERKTWPHIS